MAGPTDTPTQALPKPAGQKGRGGRGRGRSHGRLGGRNAAPQVESHDSKPGKSDGTASEKPAPMAPSNQGNKGKRSHRRRRSSFRGRNARGKSNPLTAPASQNESSEGVKIKTDSLSKVAATVGKPTSEHTKDEREDSSVLNKSIRPHLSPNHYQAEAERLTEKPAHQPKRPRWLDLWDNTSTQCICGSPQDPGVEEMSSPIIQPKGEEGKMKPSSEKPMTPYLLRLPPELRWQIYGYLFDTRRVEVYIARNKDPNSKRPINRLYCRQLRPRDPKTQFAPTVGAFNDRPFPMGLIYSCRAIYVETVLQLYLKTQFIFNSTKTVARFLKTTKRYAQASIQHVELNHVMYNEPRLTEFRYYKLRSDMAWYMVCDEMSLYFKSLKVLYATMTVWDWPIRLEVGERWSLPLLFFGRDNGVEYVNVKLDMAMFNEKKLKDASAAMEEKMMNPKTYQIREDAKMARELAGPVKTKVLKLVI